MAEPVSPAIAAVSLVTLAVAVLGPHAGPYAVIVLGSIGGGLWALSSTALISRMAGLWLMLRCMITAVVLTAIISALVGPFFGVAVTEAYAVVAFVIGALGNSWQEIFQTIKTRLQSLISTSGGKP